MIYYVPTSGFDLLLSSSRVHRSPSQELVFEIQGNGLIKIDALLECATGQNTGIAVQWVNSLKEFLGNELPECMQALDLIKATAGIPDTVSFQNQLMWHLSLQLELSLASQANSKVKKANQVVGFKWNDNGNQVVKQKLVTYIFEGIEYGKNQRTTFIASDAAPINGLHMQLSLISFPNNVCFVAPPGV